MPTALFVSPHLDDVAFSCGGTVIALGRQSWRTVVVTAFTASVPAPTGFALACQLDKGLAADVDYLAMRRAEDERFAAHAGVSRTVWLGLPEAPHRGYGSAPALFGARAPGDDVAADLTTRLARCLEDEQPDVVLAPQALGDHVDHRHVAAAVRALLSVGDVQWYSDLPYAIRRPDARSPFPDIADLAETGSDVAATIAAKGLAACSYETQLPFQFGGAPAARRILAAHASAEARRLGAPGSVEVVRTG